MSIAIPHTGLWMPRRRPWRAPWWKRLPALFAAGDRMLDSSGNKILDASGNALLDDGAGNGCCCGCDGTACTYCSGGTPSSYTLTFSGITVSPDNTCYTATSEALKTLPYNDTTFSQCMGVNPFPLTAINATWTVGVAPSSCIRTNNVFGAPSFGQLYHFNSSSCVGGFTSGCGPISLIQVTLQDSSILVEVKNQNSNFKAFVFKATIPFESGDCYFRLSGGSITGSNSLTSLGFISAANWAVGSGGSVVVQPCLVSLP